MKRFLAVMGLGVALIAGSLNGSAAACPVQLGMVAAPAQVIAVAPVVTSSAVAVPVVTAPVVSAPIVVPSIAVYSAPAVVTATPIVVQQVIRVRSVPRFRTPVRSFLFGR